MNLSSGRMRPMKKAEFLEALAQRLKGLPQGDIEKSLDYYSEMIEDRMEDGMTEEAAVAALGPLDEIANQIWMDTSLPKLIKSRTKRERDLRVWEIVLLVLGSPVWLPLLIAAIAVFFSLYIVLWSLVLVCYAVDLTFAVGTLAGLAGIAAALLASQPVQAALFLGAGLFCGGCAILLFFGCNQVTLGIARASKGLMLWLKARFVGKRGNQ